jgi:FkbM family methyltransferase
MLGRWEQGSNMAFRVFSQTGQDLLIDHVLRRQRLIPKEKDYAGYYIDIGCADPVSGSNTYFFYQRGWRGLCLDANPDVAGKFQAERPRDTFVSSGVGEKAETLTFYTFPNPQHNTFNAGRAERYPEKVCAKIEVPVQTLTWLVSRHTPPNTRIDFMSIDVEGFEMKVFQATDFDVVRPSLIVCELFATPRQALKMPSVKLLEVNGYELVSQTGHDAIFVDKSAPRVAWQSDRKSVQDADEPTRPGIR